MRWRSNGNGKQGRNEVDRVTVTEWAIVDSNKGAKNKRRENCGYCAIVVVVVVVYKCCQWCCSGGQKPKAGILLPFFSFLSGGSNNCVRWNWSGPRTRPLVAAQLLSVFSPSFDWKFVNQPTNGRSNGRTIGQKTTICDFQFSPFIKKCFHRLVRLSIDQLGEEGGGVGVVIVWCADPHHHCRRRRPSCSPYPGKSPPPPPFPF